jgi:rRNA maturation endonuclease Nob1
MKEGIKQHYKRCPVCKKEYPEEDNYCGDDGSALEQVRVAGSKHLSRSAGAPTTANDVTAERNGVQ